jgi:hypothetical protein
VARSPCGAPVVKREKKVGVARIRIFVGSDIALEIIMHEILKI